jgi:signal transduction histidine kinase
METIALTPASPPEILFKFISDHSGFGHFSYVSDGAQRVLGLSPRALCAQAQRFIDLVTEDERESLFASMEASRITLSQWIWDGQIRLPGGVDSRAISLRATPRKRSDGRVAWDGMMRYVSSNHRRKDPPQPGLSARDQMALLAAHQEQAREDERLRLARELHDDVGGNLTGIKMQLSFMSARLSAEQREVIAMDLDMLEQLVDRTIDSTRRLASNLRPPTLDLGLIPALEWFLEDFGLRTGIVVAFEAPDQDMDIAEPKKIAMFRVCQEALNNVFKHSFSFYLFIASFTIFLKRSLSYSIKGSSLIVMIRIDFHKISSLPKSLSSLGTKLKKLFITHKVSSPILLERYDSIIEG